jgi:MSHA biogenesis protein MshE
LGEVLIQQKLLSTEQVELALAEQKKSGRKLGRIFVESGFITEDALSQALARQLNMDWLDLRLLQLEPQVIRLLPEAVARRFRVVVFRDFGPWLGVAMSDPTDLTAYDEISRILRREIRISVATETQILGAIDRFYGRIEEISGLAQELKLELGEGGSDFGALFGGAVGQEDAPVVKLLTTVFEEALRTRASDIHIEPQEMSLRIRFRIDGVLHVQTETETGIASALVLRLKLMSGLDISEKRLPQDGRFNVQLRGTSLDMRVSTLPGQYGESVVMRLLHQGTGLLGLDRLHMPPRVLERLRHAVHRPSGLVLVTGPTGSGKTTTLYAMLSELNTTEKKIITVEDPVEYRLPGINQVQVHEKIDLSFGRVLRSALRQDPDIVLVGEMRDQTTAEIGMRAAMTGHMVLSTLHTNDALSTPIRLMDMGVPRYMVALSLQLVLAQRLVRVICEHCGEPYRPNPAEHEWLRAELGAGVDAHPFRHGAGCHMCGNTGYAGRTGVYEMLEMTRAVVEAANSGDPNAFIRAGRTQMAGETLRRDAVRLATTGRTTIEEAMRISNQWEDEDA